MAKKEVPKIRIITLNQESWEASERVCPCVNFRCGCECVEYKPCTECLVQCVQGEIPCQRDSEGLPRTFFKLAGDEDSK